MRYLGWCGGVVVALLVAALVYTSKEAQSLSEVKWNFAYDADGRLTWLVDPAGQVTELRYTLDDAGQVRQVTRTLPDGSHVRIELDERGRRVRMTDSSGTSRYDYDGFDRLIAVRRGGSPAVVYAYDTLGRLSAIALDDARTMQYTYDFLGRLTSIQTLAQCRTSHSPRPWPTSCWGMPFWHSIAITHPSCSCGRPVARHNGRHGRSGRQS